MFQPFYQHSCFDAINTSRYTSLADYKPRSLVFSTHMILDIASGLHVRRGMKRNSRAVVVGKMWEGR
jgi:hypothetical protein